MQPQDLRDEWMDGLTESDQISQILKGYVFNVESLIFKII